MKSLACTQMSHYRVWDRYRSYRTWHNYWFLNLDDIKINKWSRMELNKSAKTSLTLQTLSFFKHPLNLAWGKWLLSHRWNHKYPAKYKYTWENTVITSTSYIKLRIALKDIVTNSNRHWGRLLSSYSTCPHVLEVHCIYLYSIQFELRSKMQTKSMPEHQKATSKVTKMYT